MKQPAAGGGSRNEHSGQSEISLTPLGETTLLGQDGQDGYEGFVENSPEFLAQIEQLNEVWYVFFGLAVLMALAAYFVHRHLVRQHNSIKADFSCSAAGRNLADEPDADEKDNK